MHKHAPDKLRMLPVEGKLNFILGADSDRRGSYSVYVEDWMLSASHYIKNIEKPKRGVLLKLGLYTIVDPWQLGCGVTTIAWWLNHPIVAHRCFIIRNEPLSCNGGNVVTTT